MARRSPAIGTDPPPTLQAAALCFTNQHFVKFSVCVVNAYGARGVQLHTSLTWAQEALNYLLAENQVRSHDSPNGICGEEVDSGTGFGFNII